MIIVGGSTKIGANLGPDASGNIDVSIVMVTGTVCITVIKELEARVKIGEAIDLMRTDTWEVAKAMVEATTRSKPCKFGLYRNELLYIINDCK